ncbi:hypothetical protein [Neorhizobium vignae]|uniref:hypothetical protein n=1 Tax=Neorhizobium vignae TaxID=690585 RepID=UPI00056C0305|nr:hypothetical protein [Neorhizobium vignae]
MAGKHFGFGKLANIKPDAGTGPASSYGKIDAIGARPGFIACELVQRLIRRRPAEPSANLNIRSSITTFTRFLQPCERNRMPYSQRVKELAEGGGGD